MATATAEKVYCQSGDLCDGEAVESTMFPRVFRFCQKHQEQLDWVRGVIKKKNFENSAQNKTHATENYCETDGCPNRPIYGSEYCATCSGND